MNHTLTNEQKLLIAKLASQHASLKTAFPTWNHSDDRPRFFPDQRDLKAMAEKVEPFSFRLESADSSKSRFNILKILFVRLAQPVLKKVFRRQMLFNEYVWLLANTVAEQNERISKLEQKLSEKP